MSSQQEQGSNQKKSKESQLYEEQDKIHLENQVKTLQDSCEKSESYKRGYKMGVSAGFLQGYTPDAPQNLSPEAFDSKAVIHHYFTFNGQILPIGSNRDHLQALNNFNWWALVSCDGKSFRVKGTNYGPSRILDKDKQTIIVNYSGDCYNDKDCKKLMGSLILVPGNENHPKDYHITYTAMMTNFPYTDNEGEKGAKRTPATLWTGTDPNNMSPLQGNIVVKHHFGQTTGEHRAIDGYLINNTNPPRKDQLVTKKK